MEDLKKKLAWYRSTTRKALEKIAVMDGTDKREREKAKMLLDMANNYFSDAEHFEKKGLLLTALAAYSYAHAWLDAGVRLGILDGKNDDRLFTLP